MKTMIMILTLSIYSTAIFAEQADKKEIHQQLKNRYLNELSNLHPLPAPALEEEPYFLKLIVPIKRDKSLSTFKV